MNSGGGFNGNDEGVEILPADSRYSASKYLRGVGVGVVPLPVVRHVRIRAK